MKQLQQFLFTKHAYIYKYLSEFMIFFGLFVKIQPIFWHEGSTKLPWGLLALICLHQHMSLSRKKMYNPFLYLGCEQLTYYCLVSCLHDDSIMLRLRHSDIVQIAIYKTAMNKWEKERQISGDNKFWKWLF